MKINCGPTRDQREESEIARLSNWHPYFALLPRRVDPNDCRWLETIERKGRHVADWFGGDCTLRWAWEYRAKAKP